MLTGKERSRPVLLRFNVSCMLFDLLCCLTPSPTLEYSQRLTGFAHVLLSVPVRLGFPDPFLSLSVSMEINFITDTCKLVSWINF